MTFLVSLYFSLYVSNMEIERRSQALSYGTQILEKVKEYYYDDVTAENFSQSTLQNGNKQIAGIQLKKGYDVTVNIRNNDNNTTDVVKRVDVIINYPISKKQYTLTLSANKKRELLIVPNVPKLTQNLVPVKVQKIDNQINYILTNTTDMGWYNYTDKKWALAVDKSKSQSAITSSDLYAWIPRYAYNNNSIKFLYSDKDQTVNAAGALEDIGSNYAVDSYFTNDYSKGFWIKITEIDSNTTSNRLNNSQYGRLIY